MSRLPLTWNGFGYTYTEADHDAFVAWAERQENLPDDESAAMELWEQYMADEEETYLSVSYE